MAPGNNGRHPNHTGTIPKTKVRNNCNVPQEAVTPTRRDMTTNLVSTSLDWVPVSEYNTRSNYSQSRTNKPTNNTSDQELADIDNAVSFESGFGRFVPVRPQPRALPLNVQNRDISEHQDDGISSSISGHNLHPYAHQMQNGLIPHSNHAAAAVMIVNPTTPNAVAGNISQPFNAPSQNRNNLTRNLNPARNNLEGGSHASNNNSTPPASNSRTATKTVNLINNMYEQAQGGSFNNHNDNQVHRESARTLGEAIVTCSDAAAVERRLGQIREYIRVTSSLVDTMRNSEDEAFIEHTKEEYDELIQMISQLKESETKLEVILVERKPDNIEVPADENDESITPVNTGIEIIEVPHEQDKTSNIKNGNDSINNNLKKVTNIENEQLNKSMHSVESHELPKTNEAANESFPLALTEVETTEGYTDMPERTDDEELNAVLQMNILSCVDKVSRIEEMKKSRESILSDDEKEVITRPVSVQSNGSGYSDKSEVWQNEIKNKMEMSHMRLAALKQQQKRLVKYQEETKQQLDEMNRDRSQEIQPSTSHDSYAGIQNQTHGGNYNHPNRMYAANQIGVATTLPHSTDTLHGQGQAMSTDNELGDERFSHRDENIAAGEEAAGGANSEVEEDELELTARGQMLQIKLRELQMKKQHMESLVSEFQKLQMATRTESTRNTYTSSGEDSGDEEPTRKCNKAGGNNKNEDPFKLMEIKAIKTALQKTKDLMRSVDNYETEHISSAPDDSFREIASHSNIHDNKSEGGCSTSGWSNDGSVCRVRNTLPQRHKFTNEHHHSQQLHHLQQEILQQQQLTQQLPHHQQQMPHHQQQLQQNHQQQMQQNHQQQLQQNHQQQLQQTHQQQLQQNHQQQLQQNHQQQLQQTHQQQLQHNHQHPIQQHHPQQSQQQSLCHEAKIASLQELAQELRMETEKIMNERARIKDVLSNKEVSRKQKKVNEEVRPGPSGAPGPIERRQMQLRAILAEKQRELEALLNKEKVLVSTQEAQNKQESQTASVVNQSYNSDQEEPDSRSDQLLLDSQNAREIENFRASGDTELGSRPMAPLPTHVGSNYGSDSDRTDSASRSKSNQRSRPRRRQIQERLSEDSNGTQSNNTSSQNIRQETTSNVNMVPPILQNPENPGNMTYPHFPPPCWNTKSNQGMRTNQFTQNSHSQTMERLLGTPQMSFPPSIPPSMPFNMMMPYAHGVGGGCGCGCGFLGTWCWQQLALQQREIHQLREQLNHLEERWRAETASHTLNNQVPPGNRANNYWDNFRSYSRQNLLSASNKANAEGQASAGTGAGHHPLPLPERSHNPLHRAAAPASPCITPKRNTNTVPPSQLTNEEPPPRHGRRNVAYERSLSFSSAPDVLNVNQNTEDAASSTRNEDTNANININRAEPTSNFRNLNIADPIPEIIQSHSNNLNMTPNGKKKSSSKLPAKNSSHRRNFALDYSQTSNINIASTSVAPNPNLASTSREVHDKATSKLFDLLKENVYSEVTALIGINESHPDFLIQLFRELQLISSDALRQKVLHSIRHILLQYSSILESQSLGEPEDSRPEAVSTTSTETTNYNDNNSLSAQNVNGGAMQIDHKIVRFLLIKSEEYCTPELLDALAVHILSSGSADGRFSQQSKRRLLEFLAKYEGMRVCQISSDVIENLPLLASANGECDQPQLASELPESSGLQDVAGSLNLFNSGESQAHQASACPYDMWPGHIHMDMEPSDMNENSARSSQDGKVDLINCTEMHNGDLAEADQTCPTDMDDANALDEAAASAEVLPDVVDTEEVTPTEAEAEWLGLDRVPTRLHMEESSEKQKD